MLRERLKFKNSKAVYFRAELASSLAEPGSVETWSNEAIGTLFLCLSETDARERSQPIGELKRLCAAAGIAVHLALLDRIEAGGDPTYPGLLARQLVRGLKQGSVLLLYDARPGAAAGEASDLKLAGSVGSVDGGDDDPARRAMETLAVQLLLALKTSHSRDPVDAIQFMLNRPPRPDVDTGIFVFKQYLDPSYELPQSFHVKSQEIEMNQSADRAETGPAEDRRKAVFHASKFTIKVKLLTIITSLLVVSLSVMIFLASGFFRDDSELRIQENNLNLANIIGSQVESELEGIGYKANLLAFTVDQDIGTDAQQQLFVDLFFQNNPEFIFLAIAERADGGLRLKRRLYNEAYLQSSDALDRGKLDAVQTANASAFVKSLNGSFVVHNASVDVPLIGVSQQLGASVIILYMDPSRFLKAFQTQGIVQTFMVNDQGDVIAHSDSRIVLSRANFQEKPIIQALLKSPVDTGQTSYVDEDVKYLGSYRKLNIGGLGIVSTVREDRAFQAVEDIQFRNLLIMGIVLVLSFLIVYFYSNSLSVPLVRLVEGNKQVKDGNFKVHIPPSTRDEVGMLTNSFNSMVVGLDAFTKFVNKEVAELALQGDIKLGGETRDAAVFFSDLRGFTAMSEKMSPEEVVGFLNEYFTGMVDCVEQTHGIVDKFIGDAVMAHWGAFKSVGNNTENAVNGALLMRASITAFNQRLKERARAAGTPFSPAKMGCGINTGPVVVGQIGSETRLECTVIGDAVNLASRIETLNKPFRTDVLISQDSYNQVRDIFNVEAMPAIKVKGKTEPQTIYAVLGRKDDPNCPTNMDVVREMLGFETGPVSDVDPDAKEEKFEVVGGGGGA